MRFFNQIDDVIIVPRVHRYSLNVYVTAPHRKPQTQ